MGINTKKLRSEIRVFLSNKRERFLKESVLKLTSLKKSNKFKNIVFLIMYPSWRNFYFGVNN